MPLLIGTDGGVPFPVAFTADGRNVSPELRWSSLPPGTRELALIVDDPDAPRAGKERAVRIAAEVRTELPRRKGAKKGRTARD